ncbi:MAG: hypothetical protein AAGN46_09620 [Acidobacteriota bacterium]
MPDRPPPPSAADQGPTQPDDSAGARDEPRSLNEEEGLLADAVILVSRLLERHGRRETVRRLGLDAERPGRQSDRASCCAPCAGDQLAAS